MYKLPTGYTIFGFANNGNQMTAQKATSTPSQPRIIILDRNAPVWNPSTLSYSIPEYRLRVMVGTINSDGNPRPERLLADFRFRTPVGSEADHAEWLADVKSVVNDPDFLEFAVQKHMLPGHETQEGA